MLPVDWEENGLLLTKQLHMMKEDKVIGYSYRSAIMNIICKKKVEQNYLNGSEVATVFLRAKHALVAVLRMLCWTTDFLFSTD